ncbi:MAG TPA: response regulator [Patescibacteria group bacterium]|nr:response regulator [Patescibacteria group bacterium]
MLHILLIESNTLLAEVYTKALLHCGFTVAAAAGAQEAINAADEHGPDVIVMELLLPQHNGIEFLHELRSYPEWEKTPVVIQTEIVPARLAYLEPALRNDFGVGAILYKSATSLQDLIRAVREQAASR